MIEFKIGISYFTSGKVNTKVIEKIGKTLAAMANTKCSFMEEGYVVLGVADNSDSCNQWKAVYKEMQLVYGAHQIVGIEQEAERYFNGIDNYSWRVCDLINQSPITDELRDYVLANMHVVDFKGKVLLLLPAKKKIKVCHAIMIMSFIVERVPRQCMLRQRIEMLWSDYQMKKIRLCCFIGVK